MAISVAYWKADKCAVVLVLQWTRHDRSREPMAPQVTCARDGGIPHQHLLATGFSHDPIARPGSQRDLGGRPIVGGGSAPGRARPPALVVTGRAAPQVRYLAVIQDGREAAARWPRT